MSEIRTALSPYLGKRVKVRGVLSEWRDDDRGSRMCIQEPEIDGEIVATHVWVLRCPHWSEHLGDMGADVEFEALVASYQDSRHNGTRNYHLTRADELIVRSPPRLRIPDAVDEKTPLPMEDVIVPLAPKIKPCEEPTPEPNPERSYTEIIQEAMSRTPATMTAKDLSEFINREYGVEIAVTTISTTRSKLRREMQSPTPSPVARSETHSPAACEAVHLIVKLRQLAEEAGGWSELKSLMSVLAP